MRISAIWVTYILEEDGLNVIPAALPDSAELLAVQQPELILIDDWLSGQPGHSLCLRIRQLEKLRRVPVVLLSTAQDITPIMEECYTDAFIRKPFDLEELHTTVREQLSQFGAL